MTTEPQDSEKSDKPPYRIQIDKKDYEAPSKEMTGREIRDLVSPPIPETRELWEELPDDDDRKVGDEYVAEMWNGKIFYTSPRKINNGG